MKMLKKLYKQCAIKEAVILVMTWCMLFNVPLALATPAFHSSTGATVATTGNTTSVNMTATKAIIKWNSLDTSAIEKLKFNGSAGFAALNKVISGSATNFNGILDGGLGNIFIINQKGIVFGPSAIINAKTFTASALDIKDTDFLNGTYHFMGGEGAVINKGTINADGVALIGKMVQNAGTITTGAGGCVSMISGDKVYLSQNGSNIAVQAEGVSTADAIDTGSDGAGVVTAGDVINSGKINSPGGQVVLASGDIFSAALNTNDKAVKVEDGIGRVGQLGTINTSAASGNGGEISLTAGNAVALGSESITASNAGATGNGGSISVYTPGSALFRDGANVEAKGGSKSGNGGLFELSGKEYVETLGNIDLTATYGQNGMFYLDPLNLTIVAGTGSTNLNGSGGTWEPSSTSSTLGINTLEGYLQSGNVTLSTLGTVGDDYGDIIFNAGRYLTSNSNNSLFVKAERNITFNGGNGINFTGNGGVELYAGTTGGVSFVDRGMHNINIATIKGDIIIEAGSGGIDLGVLQTGHPNTSDVMPGEIRLQTTNGGDIVAQSFGINGQRYGSVYVNSAGNLTINGDEVNPEYAVHVKTVTTPGDTSAKSFICLTAEKDVTIHGKVYAEAHGVPESVAGVWIGAGTNVVDPVNGYAGTVSIDGIVQADASAAQSTKEDASVRIYASTIDVPTGSKAPIATTGSVKYQGTTSGSSESAGTVYDSKGNLISGSHALVEIDTTKDGTCLECANRIRVLLPVAVDDTWVNSKNLAVIINVVANDTDALGNLLINGTVDPASLPSTSTNGGTLAVDSSGKVVYIPPDNWKDNFDASGEYHDSFTYKVMDASGNVSENVATVTITLINQTPVAQPDAYSGGHNVVIDITGGTPANVINGVVPTVNGDTDADNQITGRLFDDQLTAHLVSGTAYGTVVLNADGTFTYTPNQGNTTGTDSFTYNVTDGYGGTSNTTTVTLNLGNTNPVAQPDAYSGGHNVVIDITGGTPANVINGVVPTVNGDTDADNQITGRLFDDQLTAHLVSGTAYGTVVLNADGTFTYTPNQGNTTGTDSFTYNVTDGYGGTSNTTTVTLNLGNTNPVAQPDAYSGGHNVVIDITGGTPANVINGVVPTVNGDTDADNQITGRLFDDQLTAHLVSGTAYGTVVLNADGTFTYTPNQGNTTGTDSFTYNVTDGYGGTSNTTTVTLNLGNTNPVAQPDAYSGGHNVVIDITGGTPANVINGVVPTVNGDTDADNQITGRLFDDQLTAHLVSGTAYGTVVLNADGTFTYTPNQGNTTGTDSFTYNVTDGYGGTSNTTTVTLNLTNTKPVAKPDFYKTKQNVSINIGLPLDVITGVIPNENGDYDIDNQINGKLFGDMLRSFLTGGVGTTEKGGTIKLNADGTFTYTPPKDFVGLDTFTYNVTDGYGGISNTTTVTITVAPGNITPPPQPPPAPPTPIIPTTNFVKHEKVDIGGCPALMQWLASEVGATADELQLQFASTMDYSTGTHPCNSCSRLKDAAAILADENGARIEALAKVVNGTVSAPGPITEEQMAVIAANFAEHTGDGTYYAQAGEWIDALAAYVAVLNKELRYSPDQSLALANKYYGPQLENRNSELAAYVAARVAAIGNSK